MKNLAQIRAHYPTHVERVGNKNVLLKLYGLGEITIGLTGDYRVKFTHRAPTKSINGNTMYDYTSKWTIESIEHHADLLLANRQRELLDSVP